MTLSKADKTPGEAYDQFMQDNKSKPMEIRKVPGAGADKDPTTANSELRKKLISIVARAIWHFDDTHSMEQLEGSGRVNEFVDEMMAAVQAQLLEARKGYVPDEEPCLHNGACDRLSDVFNDTHQDEQGNTNQDELFKNVLAWHQSELAQAVAEARLDEAMKAWGRYAPGDLGNSAMAARVEELQTQLNPQKPGEEEV